MADKKDYAAIAELEKLLAENALHFEAWKTSHINHRGTAEYNTGVSRFIDYDRDLRTRIATLQGINVESGPKNIDAVLDELLDKVDLMGFVRAIQIVNSSDPTFYSKLQQASENRTRTQVRPEVFRNMAMPQFYPGFASTPYTFTAPQVTVGPIPAYRPPPPVIKIQRPVSPVRDYQKKTGAPFRDFSV
ncbi:unnamed protein product [Caenorhabditis sp. 36 PRJEB53466]|nr:unnamed protein product [Caenorhabditis sp. 36 PRJEB53466]